MGNFRTLQAPSVGLSGSVVSEVKALLKNWLVVDVVAVVAVVTMMIMKMITTVVAVAAVAAAVVATN